MNNISHIGQSMIISDKSYIDYVTIERLDIKTVMNSPSSILIIGGDGMGKSHLGRYLFSILVRNMNIAFITNERDRLKFEEEVGNNTLIYPNYRHDVISGLKGAHTKLLLLDCDWDTLNSDFEHFILENDGYIWRIMYVITALSEMEGDRHLYYAWRFFFIRKYFLNSYMDKRLKWYPHNYEANYRKFHTLFKLHRIISENYFVELMKQIKEDQCIVIDILTKKVSWMYIPYLNI